MKAGAPVTRILNLTAIVLAAAAVATAWAQNPTVPAPPPGTQVASDARAGLGGAIAVDRSDRRYPIYAAQQAFLSGLEEEAWPATQAARELIASEAKNLEPAYLLWIVTKATAKGDLAWADRVVRDAIDLLETTGGPIVDNETRVRIFVAKADIAAAREDYPLAKALYERIALNKNFEGTRARNQAELGIVDVERLTRDYGGAIRHLEALIKRDDVFVKARANYLMALVKNDQDEYKEAREYLNQAILLDPRLADARILEGRINLRLKKLDLNNNITFGPPPAVLIPGRPLTIQVVERNLSIIGAATGIEVRVWTKLGDEEIMVLRPFGDSKGGFKGENPTMLGVATKGDRILQVLGGDQVFYDFSERFKEAQKIVGATAPAMIVRSDAELFVSPGAFRSAAEMTKVESQRQPQESGPPVSLALGTAPGTDEINPGAKIHVRVVDPDRSLTAEKDRVSVRAVATSGDVVQSFELDETEGCSGVFEGELKTGVAPVIAASASDNNEGADPNFAVSAGDYPPWIGLTDARRPKMFWVDLNDDVAVKTLAVQADVPGRRLKRFAVQTSRDGKEFTTVGAWPEATAPWNGALQATLMRVFMPEGFAKAKPSEQAAMIREALEIGGEPGTPAPVVVPGALAANLGAQIMGMAAKLGVESDPASPWSWYVLRLRGGFYLPKRAERLFRANVNGTAFNVLVVDGRAADMDKRIGSVAVGGWFDKGVHTVEFYLWAQRGAQVSYALECDIKEAPYFGTCPADMFDVARNLQIPVALQFTPASVTAQPENNGFDIAFATNSQARVVRLVLLDFESDAPAIRRLKLTAADGRVVLPTREDLIALRKNTILETRVGDRITITYEDPTPVTKEKRSHEAHVTVRFRDREDPEPPKP